MIPEKVAYRVNEFVQAFGVSRARTFQLIAAGELRVAKHGRITLITAESAKDWLRRGDWVPRAEAKVVGAGS